MKSLYEHVWGGEIAVSVKKLRNLIKKRSFQNGFSNSISIFKNSVINFTNITKQCILFIIDYERH